MKKIIFALFIIGCNTKSEAPIAPKVATIEDKIKTYIQAVANDPASYQPISTVLVDSTTYLKDLSHNIDSYSNYLNSLDKKYQSWHQIEKSLDSLNLVMDSLLKSNQPYALYSYTFSHTCRLKNGFGALTLQTYKVTTLQNLTVINMVEENK